MAYTYIKRTGGVVDGKIQGLNHLEGLSPLLIVDGKPIGNFLVTSGEIDMPAGLESTSEIIVGLEYECSFETLPMTIQSAQGIAFGQHKRLVGLGLYLYQALGLTVDTGSHEDLWDFRQGDDLVNYSPPLFTGYKENNVDANYTEETTIKIKQTQPFPLNINLMQITIDQGF